MKLKLPVTPHIRKQLAASSVKHGKHVAVDYQSYAHFQERIDREYRHLSEPERDALIVTCCLTHPNHRKKHASRKWRWILPAIAVIFVILFFALAARAQGTSQIDVITFQDAAGVPIKSFAAPFKIKCSTNVTCAASGSVLTVTASGGGAGGYATVQNAGVAIVQEPVLNFLGALACVDNAGNTSSDCKISANIAVAHQFLTGIDASGNFTRAQPAYSDLTGTPTLPATKAAVGSNWINSYDATTGLFTATRPDYSDITSLPQLAQTKFAVANKFLTEYNASNGLFQFAQPASTNLSDFSAVAASHTGMLPIWDQPSTTYIPGDPIITGPDANGAVPVGNPVVTAGWDGTNVRRVKTDAAGVVQVNVTGLNVACAGLPALTGDITSPSGSCATTLAPTIAGAHSFTGTITYTGPNPYFDPRNYGVNVCSGSGDDTTAFNSAISAANTAGGGWVLIPTGSVCVIAGQLNMASMDGVRLAGTPGIVTFNTPKPILKFTGTTSPLIDARSSQGLEFDHFTVQYTNAAFAGRVIDFQHLVGVDSQNFRIHDMTITGTSTAKGAICLVCADNTDVGSVDGVYFFWALHAVEALTSNIFRVSNSNFGSGVVGVGDITGDYITDLGNNNTIGPNNNFEMSTNVSAIHCSTCGNNINIFQNTGNDFVAGYSAVLFNMNSNLVNAQDNFVGLGPGGTSTFFSGAGAQGTFNLVGNTLGNWGTAWIGLNGPAKSVNIQNNGYGTIGTFLNICCPTSGTIQDNNGLTTMYGTTVFAGSANKTGQADIVASSGAINTSETVIVKTPALAASRLVAGTHFRIILMGTCTSTVANVSTFTLRWGTNGTTADGTVAALATSAAATSGTNNGFRTVIDLTVRTAGASATSNAFLQLTSDGNIGIVATPNAKSVAGTAFNTTTVSGILSLAYKSAATTTTTTFTNATIEIVQN